MIAGFVVNLFFLGIIGEYIGRVYEEAKGRPHYVIRKIIGKRSFRSSDATMRCYPASALVKSCCQ